MTRRQLNNIALSVVLLFLMGCSGGFDRDTDIYIVNMTGQEATISIQGRDPIVVPDDTLSHITLTSGTYKVELQLGESFKRKLSFAVSRGKGNPFDDNTIGVLNIQGRAPIIMDEHFFAVEEGGSEDDPWASHIYNTQVFFGQDYFEVGNIDYPFQPVPEEINITDLVAGESRYQLRMPHGDRFNHLDEVFGYAPDSSRAMLGYAEFMIEHGMNDLRYVSRYIDNSRYYDERTRGEAFLVKHGYAFEGWIMFQEVVNGTRYLTQISDPPYGFVPGVDSIVIPKGEKVSVFIDYPVAHPSKFEILPDKDEGYTKWGIVSQLKDLYKTIYQKEDTTAGGATASFIDLSENRATTEGVYGIHSYYYEQLFISAAQVVRMPNDEIVLRLWVEGLKEEKEKGT